MFIQKDFKQMLNAHVRTHTRTAYMRMCVCTLCTGHMCSYKNAHRCARVFTHTNAIYVHVFMVQAAVVQCVHRQHYFFCSILSFQYDYRAVATIYKQSVHTGICKIV